VSLRLTSPSRDLLLSISAYRTQSRCTFVARQIISSEATHLFLEVTLLAPPVHASSFSRSTLKTARWKCTKGSRILDLLRFRSSNLKCFSRNRRGKQEINLYAWSKRSELKNGSLPPPPPPPIPRPTNGCWPNPLCNSDVCAVNAVKTNRKINSSRNVIPALNQTENRNTDGGDMEESLRENRAAISIWSPAILHLHW